MKNIVFNEDIGDESIFFSIISAPILLHKYQYASRTIESSEVSYALEVPSQNKELD